MKASHEAIGVSLGLVIILLVFLNEIVAQTTLEAPVFSDPTLLAAIFVPSKPARTFEEPVTQPNSEFTGLRQEFQFKPRRVAIPKDWQAFEKQFAPEQHNGKPALQLIENGMYQVNQLIYSVKLFERNINSLLNFEWSLHELTGYDPRTKANALDSMFDHAKVKTDFEWDAPVGLYVGVRFQLKCDSIFQFWK
jgi:hypothetical protein